MKNARIFLVFFIAAIVGTLAHECGHTLFGEMVGFKTSLHYQYTSCKNCYDAYIVPPKMQMLFAGMNTGKVCLHRVVLHKQSSQVWQALLGC